MFFNHVINHFPSSEHDRQSLYAGSLWGLGTILDLEP